MESCLKAPTCATLAWSCALAPAQTQALPRDPSDALMAAAVHPRGLHHCLGCPQWKGRWRGSQTSQRCQTAQTPQTQSRRQPIKAAQEERCPPVASTLPPGMQIAQARKFGIDHKNARSFACDLNYSIMTSVPWARELCRERSRCKCAIGVRARFRVPVPCLKIHVRNVSQRIDNMGEQMRL